MLNAVLFTKGSMGDLVPFMAIGRALKQRGHQVTLVTHEAYSGLAAAAGFRFEPIDNQEEYAQFIADGQLLNTPYGVPKFFQKHLLPKTEREYKLLISLVSRSNSVLVSRFMGGLSDIFAHEQTGVPLVRVYLNVSQMRGRQLLSQLCNTVLADDIRRSRRILQLSDNHQDMGWEWQATSHLAAWPGWFYKKTDDWPSHSTPVGFLIDDECENGPLPDEARLQLEAAKLPILVSGGTGDFIGASFYTAVLEGCTGRGYTIFVTARRRDFLPETLPDDVIWFQRLPFTTVMPRVAAVIHHAGTGIAARALLNGVPQLLLPFGGDRPDTAARIESLGVARMILPPAWTSERVSRELVQLLGSGKVRDRCRAFSTITKRSQSAETSADAVEHAVASTRVGLADSLQMQ